MGKLVLTAVILALTATMASAYHPGPGPHWGGGWHGGWHGGGVYIGEGYRPVCSTERRWTPYGPRWVRVCD